MSEDPNVAVVGTATDGAAAPAADVVGTASAAGPVSPAGAAAATGAVGADAALAGADIASLAGAGGDPAINIVLVEPEIPQNTGNIARTCACTGARLHLVEPMGFALTQRNLARAGCDYWDEVDIVRWACAEEFFEAHGADELHLFTGHATRNYADVRYGPGSYLVFGRESRGLDERWMSRYADACVRIPMREGLRSLNLSNSAAIAAFEALRQLDWPHLR